MFGMRTVAGAIIVLILFVAPPGVSAPPTSGITAALVAEAGNQDVTGRAETPAEDPIQKLLRELEAKDEEIARLRSEAAWLRSFVTVSSADGTDAVAITMDDLRSQNTPLAILTAKQKQAPLTLFPVGDAIVAHPEWFLEAIEAGFEIGNHTSTHEVLDKLPLAEAEKRIADWNSIALEKLGYTARFFRPPARGGWSDRKGQPDLRAAVARQGLVTVLWDVETMWPVWWETGPRVKGANPTSQAVADYVVSEAKAGSIICLHDTVDTRALPFIIDGLRAKGFRLVTLSELLGYPVADPVFTDLKGYDWARTAIESLAGQEILRGMGGGRVDPGGVLTRDQVATLIQRLFELPQPAQPVSYSDVPPGHWAYSFVQACSPYIPPLAGDTFGAGVACSREDAAAALVRVLDEQALLEIVPPGEADTILAGVPDAGEITPALRQLIATSIKYGIVRGLEDGSFVPAGMLTRAQAAVLLDRVQTMFFR